MKQTISFVAFSLILFFGQTTAFFCPSGGFSKDPFTVNNLQKTLALQIFDTVPASTSLTTQALNELRAMMHSTTKYHRDLGYTVALYLSVFKDNLGSGSPVTFCPLARAIDGYLSGNSTQLRLALEGLRDFESILSTYRRQNSIINSGCSAPSLIGDIVFSSCPGNGFTYNMEGLISTRGYVLPANLLAIIPQLYASSNIIDKLISLFVCSFTTPQMQTLFEKYPLPLSLRATSLSSTSSSFECCPDRLKILGDLSFNTAKAAVNIFNNMIRPSHSCGN